MCTMSSCSGVTNLSEQDTAKCCLLFTMPKVWRSPAIPPKCIPQPNYIEKTVADKLDKHKEDKCICPDSTGKVSLALIALELFLQPVHMALKFLLSQKGSPIINNIAIHHKAIESTCKQTAYSSAFLCRHITSFKEHSPSNTQ